MRLKELNKFPIIITTYLLCQLPVFWDYFTHKSYRYKTISCLLSALSCVHFLSLALSVSEQELNSMIPKSKPTTYLIDPIPTSLFLNCLGDLLPTLSQTINDNLQSGSFLSLFNMLSLSQFSKLSLVHLKNYHPVSNYSFLSKVTKKIVTQQLLILISADCLCHSTKISLLKITNSILHALHDGDMLKTCLDPYWSVFCLWYYWPPYSFSHLWYYWPPYSFSQTPISLQHL